MNSSMDNQEQKHGHNIPPKYFDEFEDRLFTKLSEEKLPKNTGFKVPEGYFNDLENTILTRANKQKETNKVIPLFTKKTWYYALAIASCAILVLTLSTDKKTNIDINTISIETIASYIEEEEIHIDSYDIASYLTTDDLSTEVSLPIENEEIENYLIDNLGNTLLILE